MHPILFKLSSLTFHSYGFFLGMGILLGYRLTLLLAGHEKLPLDRVRLLVGGVVVAGFIGGHLHALATDETLQAQGAGFFQGLGFTFYGASLSGMVAAFPLTRLLKIDLWKMLDVGAPGVPLAHGIGRIGCFMYGCCYGVRCDETNPLAVHFPPGSPAFNDQIDAHVLSASAPHALPVVPIMLLESAWELGVAAALAVYVWHRPRRLGSVVLIYLAAYGPLRVVLEQYRADPGRGTLLGLSTSTTIGLTTTAFGLIFLLVPRLAALRPLRAAEVGKPEVEKPEVESPETGEGRA